MSCNITLDDHPRPLIKRDAGFHLLDGDWDFVFDDADEGLSQRWDKHFPNHTLKIEVPFTYETQSSGINIQERHDTLWYKKTFSYHACAGKKILLHFNAVDYEAKVWFNKICIGEHKGGYAPFSFDVTDYLQDENEIIMRTYDSIDCSQPRGKQSWKGIFGCWYHPTSGIWQSVWLEEVGSRYIKNIRITPNIDERNIICEVEIDKLMCNTAIHFKMQFHGKNCINITFDNYKEDKHFRYILPVEEESKVDEMHYWSPESPNLYDLEITLGFEGEEIDSIHTYFGMRKISIVDNAILLNNKPYYQRLILDQGYWKESGLTPPNEQSLIDDIVLTKEMGFNGVRKHQKIEDTRYYYWADKLGLLVWGELPSAYEFNHREMRQLTEEMIDFIERDYNHPCIVAWVPLNESWGVRNIVSDYTQQQFGRGLYHLIKAMDTTRFISTNDGWEMIEASDIAGFHDYEPIGKNLIEKTKDIENFFKGDAQGRLLFAHGEKYKGEPILATEFGGIAFEKDATGENWGYHEPVNNEEDFLKRFESIVHAIIDNKDFVGFCYTQLTDVFQEVNGLLDMQRNPKIPIDKIKKIITKKRSINLYE